MKRTIACVALLLLAMVTHSLATPKKTFDNIELKNLRLVGSKDGKAVILAPDRKKAEITIGDRLGQGEEVVVEIEPTHITMQKDNIRTRMLLIYGFE